MIPAGTSWCSGGSEGLFMRRECYAGDAKAPPNGSRSSCEQLARWRKGRVIDGAFQSRSDSEPPPDHVWDLTICINVSRSYNRTSCISANRAADFMHASVCEPGTPG